LRLKNLKREDGVSCVEDLKKMTIDFLKVLSDPIRLDILEFIKNNPSTSRKIQVALNISQSFASHQLKKLYDADLIEYDKKGKIKIYRPKNMGIYKLIALIQSYVFNLEKEKLRKFSLIKEFEPISDFSDIS
jgi:DNA-binding transcriptional ArsR family regulator